MKTNAELLSLIVQGGVYTRNDVSFYLMPNLREEVKNMSDIKIASAKFVDGYFLYKKLFLVFTLFFSMDSYSWISLKIDHKNSSKDHAVIHIVENEHIIKTEEIAGNKVYISRHFTLDNNEIKTRYYVIVKQSTGTISCRVLRHHDETCKHHDEDGGWNRACKRRIRLWSLSPESECNEVRYSLQTTSFQHFSAHYSLLKDHYCSDKCTPFIEDLYKGFLCISSMNIKTKEFHLGYHAVLDHWQAGD